MLMERSDIDHLKSICCPNIQLGMMPPTPEAAPALATVIVAPPPLGMPNGWTPSPPD